MENWRGFQIVNEVTSMKEANILVETRTMRLTLEELDRSYKDKKISRRSYQNIRQRKAEDRKQQHYDVLHFGKGHRFGVQKL